MATLSIVNGTASDIFIDNQVKVLAMTTKVITCTPSLISKRTMLLEAVEAGLLSYTTAYTSAEIACGAGSPTGSVQAQDMAPVTLTDAANNATLANGCFIIQRTLASGGATGTADDVVIFAATSIPTVLGPKIRILDAWALISSAGDTGTSMTVRTAAAGGGTALVTIATNATGQIRWSTAVTASNLVTVASDGLIVRRSDRSAVGKIFILCSKEN